MAIDEFKKKKKKLAATSMIIEVTMMSLKEVTCCIFGLQEQLVGTGSLSPHSQKCIL